MTGVFALHQPVKPQGLAEVMQLKLVALPCEGSGVPGPGGFTTAYTAGHGPGVAGLVGGQTEFARDPGHPQGRVGIQIRLRICRTHRNAKLEQPVHGLADVLN